MTVSDKQTGLLLYGIDNSPGKLFISSPRQSKLDILVDPIFCLCFSICLFKTLLVFSKLLTNIIQKWVQVNQHIHFPLSATYFLLLPALMLATFCPNMYVSVVPAGEEGGKSGKQQKVRSHQRKTYTLIYPEPLEMGGTLLQKYSRQA